MGYDKKVEVTFNEDGSLDVSIDNFILILQLIGVLIVIYSWHIYMTLSIAYQKRRKIHWVEVQDYFQPEYAVSRIQAKMNIYQVDEITKRLKSFN